MTRVSNACKSFPSKVTAVSNKCAIALLDDRCLSGDSWVYTGSAPNQAFPAVRMLVV